MLSSQDEKSLAEEVHKYPSLCSSCLLSFNSCIKGIPMQI